MEQDDIIKKVNAIQILLEAIADELIEKNLITEESILNRLDSLGNEIDEVKSVLYFGPIGEA